MSDIDENTKKLDKLAYELSDYLNEANKIPPVSQETLGCGNAMVYDDIYDTIIVDPKTLNVECNFLDRSLDMYVIPIFKGYLPDKTNARKIFLDFLNNNNGMSYHKKIKVFFKDFDIYDVIKKVYDDLVFQNIKIANQTDVTKSINKILNIPNKPDKNTIYNNTYVARLIISEIIFLFAREIGGTIYYFGGEKRDHSNEVNLLPSLETAIQIIEYIKLKIEQENKDETNIKLIYTIFSFLKATEIIQELLQENLLFRILGVTSSMATGQPNDINNYIKDNNILKNIDVFFKLPRIPNSKNSKDSKISKELTIQQYNNVNNNFIDFDNNNHLIVTTYCTKIIQAVDEQGDPVFIIFLLNKREYNITQNTYNEYNKIYWTDNRLKNPENTFLNNLNNILFPRQSQTNPTTGGRRKPRKTVKRKKNTTMKRKRSKSRKIMQRRRRHHRR
jgi:hypothetical protein